MYSFIDTQTNKAENRNQVRQGYFLALTNLTAVQYWKGIDAFRT